MNGFTLIEMMVVIGILSVLLLLTFTAWPRVRERQALLLAEHQLHDLLRHAQEQAFHEVRRDTCLDQYSSTDSNRHRCSDAGVAFRGRTVRLFADTVGENNRYTEDDFLLEEHVLPGGTETDGTTWQSFLFKATPPNIMLFDQSGALVVGEGHATLVLKIGSRENSVNILPYGQIAPAE